jgi:hypothetical protein
MSEYRFARKSSKKFGEVYEPTIPVEIIGPNKTVEALMVVDSGADISLLPHWVAEIVGLHLNSENRRDIHGIGDESIPYILDTVRMRIADSEITPRIAWALGEEVPFVLGRLDVFKEFSIEFREFEDKIIIERAGRN